MRKIKKYWQELRWVIIGALWIISLLLGYWGFTRYSIVNNEHLPIFERIYRSLQLISMNSGAVDGEINWMLEVARFILPLLTAITVIQAIANFFREQTQWLRLWGVKNHVIICGLGRKGRAVVNHLISEGMKLVVIEKEVDPIIANEYRKKGVIVLEADATDRDTLSMARLKRAKYLICLIGNDQINLTIAHQAYNFKHKDSQSKLICIVHITSQELLDLFKRSELVLSDDNAFDLEFFNIYQRISHQLIIDEDKWHKFNSEDDNHLLIVGLGRLGQNILIGTAFNRYKRDSFKKLNMTLIDLEIDRKIAHLNEEYPKLSKVCQITPLEIDADSNYSLKNKIDKVLGKNSFDRVYICFGNPILSLKVSLALNELPQLEKTPFFIRMESGSGLADILHHPIAGLESHQNLIPFDLYNETCTADLILGGFQEFFARHLRENYLKNLGSSELENMVLVKWKDLPEDEKENNLQQASRIYTLLTAHGYQIHPLQDWDAYKRTFSYDDVELMAKMEHELWCQWKRDNGWKFGPIRDPKNKRHPDLIAWDRLEETEQDKNKLFIADLPSLLADLGFQIKKIF